MKPKRGVGKVRRLIIKELDEAAEAEAEEEEEEEDEDEEEEDEEGEK